MHRPAHIVEIFLQPGDFYFGDRNTRIRTLLGSCISFTVWHPKLLIGGMCHYMLPTRRGQMAAIPDGRYGDEAMELILKEVRGAGTRPGEYEVKLFGGSHMFQGKDKRKPHCMVKTCDPFSSGCQDVACRNQHAARRLAQTHGFSVKAEHMGGVSPRNLFFDVWSGYAWIKRNLPVAECAFPVMGVE